MTRQIAAIIALAVIVAVIVFAGPAACRKWQSERAQSRVDTAQAGAASNSAGDAIGTVARSGEAAATSEELTRSNEKDIRNAEGAKDRVNPHVDAAGRRALCLRDSYIDSDQCKLFRAPAR